jgi:hypothetical protein
MVTTVTAEFKGKRYNSAADGLRALAQDISADFERAGPALRGELQFYLNAVALAMEKRHSSPWQPGTSAPQHLYKRSGKLVQSIKDSVTVSGQKFDDIEGRIGSSLVYANIQEYGGDIVPKNSKYLAIPLPAAMDSRGIPLMASPRDWANTFVAKSKAGNLLIFQKKGKDIIPLYVLRSKVTIPPRLGLGDTLRTGASSFVDRAMTAMLKAMVDNA